MTSSSGTNPARLRRNSREDARVTTPVEDRTSTNRRQAAAVRADEAFGAAVTDAYPETTTGDLTPSRVAAWDKAGDSALSGWVATNVPGAGPA